MNVVLCDKEIEAIIADWAAQRFGTPTASVYVGEDEQREVIAEIVFFDGDDYSDTGQEAKEPSDTKG